MTNRAHPFLRSARHGQRGVVLIIALIVLVVMSMAGVLMLRSLNSGLGIAGNVAFKEGTTLGADRGVEAARAFIMNPLTNKDKTELAVNRGYYDTWNGGVAAGQEFDPYTYAWGDPANAGNTASMSLGTENGNTVQYVIHRLCEMTNATANATGQVCVSSEAESAFGSTSGSTGVTQAKQRVPHFRVTTRVLGPRDTVSFVQVILY